MRRERFWRSLPLGVGCLFALSGCAGPYTSLPLSDVKGGTAVNGIPYYLPIGYVPIAIQGTPPAVATAKPYTLKPTFGTPIYLPDTSKAYFLRMNHSLLSDDHFTLQTNQNGLLQSVDLQATDQTGQILVQLATLAAQIALVPATFTPPPRTLSTNPTPLPSEPTPPKPCDLPAYQWMANIDPSVSTMPQVPPLTDHADQHISFLVRSTEIPTKSELPQPPHTSPPGRIDAIYFPTLTTYKIKVTAKVSPAAQASCQLPRRITQTALVALPNGGGVFAEDVSRAFAVDRHVSLTVQNGILTQVDDTHPSEIYGAVQIPGQILSRILAIPSNLLTFHIQQLQNQGTLTAAQAALLQNELTIITNQAALKAAQQQQSAAAP